jgi:peptide subunit release factor 1 (eRF1)
MHTLRFLQINRVTKMLQDEYGTASNIKSRVNRLSVLSAITSAQQRLKLYNRVRGACLSTCFAHALHRPSPSWSYLCTQKIKTSVMCF